MIHAEGNVYNGGDKGASQPGKIAPYDKDCCKNQADINAHGADHLPVDRSRPGYLAHFSLIHDEPENDRHKGPHEQEKKVIYRERQAKYRDRSLKELGHGDRPVFRAPYEFHEVPKDEG